MVQRRTTHQAYRPWRKSELTTRAEDNLKIISGLPMDLSILEQATMVDVPWLNAEAERIVSDLVTHFQDAPKEGDYNGKEI